MNEKDIKKALAQIDGIFPRIYYEFNRLKEQTQFK